MRLQISLEDVGFTSYSSHIDRSVVSGLRFVDLSNSQNVSLTTGSHGCETLNGFTPMNSQRALMIYRTLRTPTLYVNAGPFVVWKGRLEDVRIIKSSDGKTGLQWAAFGQFRYFDDVLYTALWSTYSLAGYEIVTEDDLVNTYPQLFYIDMKDRIYFAQQKNAQLGSNEMGAVVYWSPHLGVRNIARVTFTYDVDLPTNYFAEMRIYDEGFASGNTEWFVVTSGSGSASVTISSPGDGILFRIRNGSGIAYTEAGETGTHYAKFTDIRVMTTTSGKLVGSEIAEALLAYLETVNASKINQATNLIDTVAEDLTEVEWQDRTLAFCLRDLIAMGEGSTPPEYYETGIQSDSLYFRERGSAARTWYVDVSEYELLRTLGTVVNEAYAVYQDEMRRTRRTTSGSSSVSQDKYDLTRQDFIRSKASQVAEAERERDAFLESVSDPPHKIEIEVLRVTTVAGLTVPVWHVKAGDTIVINGAAIMPGTPETIFISFRAARTKWRMGKEFKIEPEALSPSTAWTMATGRFNVSYV